MTGKPADPAPAHIARRMAEIQPFHVMDLLARARALEAQGRSIIHLEVGEPDFDTPRPICDAARTAMEQGLTHYTQAVGLTALRERIARYYAEDYGVAVSPERIIVTPGASGALMLALSILVNPGEQVLMTDPGYPCNRHFVRLLEGKAVGIAVGADSHYQLSLDLLQAHWTEQTVAALLASPANPTGTVIPLAEIRAMQAFVRAQGGVLLVDEIYQGLVYDGDPQTALSVSDEIIVINSFSKYFSMTGWRLGWLVLPPAYVRLADNLAQNIFLAPPTLSQYAAMAAFDVQTRRQLEHYRAEFRRRRDYLLPALRELGFGIATVPEGAFYLYADCSAFTDDSYAFALDILDKAGVAITPGIDFGSHQPERHVRFSYTTSLECLQAGVERLRQYLQSH